MNCLNSKHLLVQKTFLFFAIFLCMKLVCFAEEYRFDSWTTDDGLPQNTVNAVTQSSDGYLWVATFDELARFDGVSFTVINRGNTKWIKNNRFRGVYADDDNVVWAFTDTGVLTVYRHGVFESFELPQALSERIRNVYRNEDGRIIIETRERVYSFEQNQLVPLSENEQFNPQDAYSNNLKSVWKSVTDGISHLENGKVIVYPFENKKNSPLFASGPNRAFEDSSGTLWIDNEGDLYHLRNGEVNIYKNDISELNRNKIKISNGQIIGDRNGNIWIVNRSEDNDKNEKTYLQKFDGEHFQAIETDKKLQSGFVDRAGNIWFGSLGQGLVRLRKRLITTISVKDGLPGEEVYPLIQIL